MIQGPFDIRLRMRKTTKPAIKPKFKLKNLRNYGNIWSIMYWSRDAKKSLQSLVQSLQTFFSKGWKDDCQIEKSNITWWVILGTGKNLLAKTPCQKPLEVPFVCWCHPYYGKPVNVGEDVSNSYKTTTSRRTYNVEAAKEAIVYIWWN